MSGDRPDPIAKIRELYFNATPGTILRDFDLAIDLLKSLQNEGERERAAVYMEGLAELRRELGPKARGTSRRRQRS